MSAKSQRAAYARNGSAETDLHKEVAALPPGWSLLAGDALRRDPAWAGRVEAALIHPEIGVALLGPEPCAGAVEALKRAFDAAGFGEAFGGHPAIVYRVLPPPGLPLGEVLDAAFSLEPPLALSDGTEWATAARAVLTAGRTDMATEPEQAEATPARKTEAAPPAAPPPARKTEAAPPAARPVTPMPLASAEGSEARRPRRNLVPLLFGGIALAAVGCMAIALRHLELLGSVPPQSADGAERPPVLDGGSPARGGGPGAATTGPDAQPAPNAGPIAAPDGPVPLAPPGPRKAPEQPPPPPKTPAATPGKHPGQGSGPGSAPPDQGAPAAPKAAATPSVPAEKAVAAVPAVPPAPSGVPPTPTPPGPGPLARTDGNSPDPAPVDSFSLDAPMQAAPTATAGSTEPEDPQPVATAEAPAASDPAPPDHVSPPRDEFDESADRPPVPAAPGPLADRLDTLHDPALPDDPRAPTPATAPESGTAFGPASPEAPEASFAGVGSDAARRDAPSSPAAPEDAAAQPPWAPTPAAPTARTAAAPADDAPSPPSPPLSVQPPPVPPHAYAAGPSVPAPVIVAPPPQAAPAVLAPEDPSATAAPSPDQRAPSPAKRRNERQQTVQSAQPTPPPVAGRCRSAVVSAQLGEELSAADLTLMRTKCEPRTGRVPMR